VINSSIIPPAILACPIVFGVPIMFMVFLSFKKSFATHSNGLDL
jgi:hypothetical protein